MTRQEFNSTWLPLSSALYRVAFYILEDDADARDVVQDTFVKLWNSRDTLSSVTNPQAFAIRVLRNLCLDRVRAAKRHRMESVEAIRESGVDVRGDAPPPDRIDRETLSHVLKMIEELPPKQRDVLKMRVFEDKEYEEISRLTGMSQINVRVNLSMARKTLRNRLNQLK